jgi:hypothetical protein
VSMRLSFVAIACAVACSNGQPSLDDLVERADKITADEQPIIDELVSRVNYLKFNMGGNLPGWEKYLTIGDIANNALGLPPFTQTSQPLPSWRPNPTTLLGMGPYAHDRARKLAHEGKRHDLEFLIEDERRRYDEGVAHVDDLLKQVEQWVAQQRGSGSSGSAQ